MTTEAVERKFGDDFEVDLVPLLTEDPEQLEHALVSIKAQYGQYAEEVLSHEFPRINESNLLAFVGDMTEMCGALALKALNMLKTYGIKGDASKCRRFMQLSATLIMSQLNSALMDAGTFMG